MSGVEHRHRLLEVLMPRRPEPAELVAARDLVRANFDAQLSAVAAFFEAATRLVALRGEVDAVEADQQVHAGALAELLGVDTAARVTGWSKGRLGEAQRTQRSRRESRPTVAGGDGRSDAGTRSQLDGDTAAAER
jgi:hypothetical protein